MTPPLTTVFVYGTLMPGERNEHIAARGGHFHARPAQLRGYRLFNLTPEHYPGTTRITPGDTTSENNTLESNTGTVQGYALTYELPDWQAALPFLDELEGLHETPPLYTREQVTLTLEGGTPVPAWVYVYARAERLQAPGVQLIPSGNWREANNRDQHGADDR